MLRVDELPRLREKLDDGGLLLARHVEEVGDVALRNDEDVACAQRMDVETRIRQRVLGEDRVTHAQLAGAAHRSPPPFWLLPIHHDNAPNTIATPARNVQNHANPRASAACVGSEISPSEENPVMANPRQKTAKTTARITPSLAETFIARASA